MISCNFDTMSYSRSCIWCRKPFEAKRKDNVYCSSKCKLKRFQMVRGFELIENLLPEEQVKEKYYVPADSECVIYLHWFRVDGERFADVYISKNCPDLGELIKRYKKNTFPTRVVFK